MLIELDDKSLSALDHFKRYLQALPDEELATFQNVQLPPVKPINAAPAQMITRILRAIVKEEMGRRLRKAA